MNGTNKAQLNDLLLIATMAGDAAEVERRLIAGADVNCRMEDGWTPLLQASIHGPELVRLLLAHSADMNAASDLGYTALHRAAAKGDTEVVKLLLEAGADVLAREIQG